MTTQIKAISLRASYEGDLSGLRQDLRTLKSVRRQLERRPILLAVKLDLSGLRSEATRAAMEYKRALTAAMGTIPTGGSTTAGGIFVPPSAMADLARASAAAGKEVKRVTTLAEDGSVKAVRSLKQLEDGLQQLDSSRKKKGKTVTETQLIDTKPVAKLRRALDQIERDFSSKIGHATGTGGDIAKVLRAQREAVEKEVAAYADLDGTSEFRRAKKMQDSLAKRIARADAGQVVTAGKKQEAATRNMRSVNRSLDQQRERDLKAEQIRQQRAAEKSTRDNRNSRVKSLQSALDGIDKATATTLGSTKGKKGDVAAVLDTKRTRISRALASFADIADTPAFRAAQKAITTLDKQIAQAGASQTRTAERTDQTRSKEAAQRMIAREDRRLGSAIRTNKTAESDAGTLTNRIARESELNRVMDQRERILAAQALRYQQLAALARGTGRTQAGEKYDAAALRTRKDLEQAQLDRARARNFALTTGNERGLESRYLAAKRLHAEERESLNLAERHARAIKNRTERERELKAVIRQRVALTARTRAAYSAVGAEARVRGDYPMVKRLDSASSGLARESQRDMGRLATATRSSGHALDFHTSSLLKNAATFAEWYLPAQAAMGVFSAIGNGISSAIAAQRTFKVLHAVFRGSREEATLLSQQTLLLASANGRSAQEAADSAVTWSRLGLTRVQVLTALETSLRAANVAEISAADATKHLASTYKAFGLSIGELPVVLDYLNSLSNQYNVTVEDLMNGMSRSSAVARQAGVSYQELGAIIATVADRTARPGAEIGNSIKSVLNRLARPEIRTSLKAEFEIDTTTADGDLKKATDIFQELAAIYPTLNKLEQARFTNLVAGSLQSNRFTVVLENYTDVLIAQAKAGLDANSAARENAEILSSLDAQLNAVTTSWTAFILGLGETGIFTEVADGLEAIRRGLNFLTPAARKASGDYQAADLSEEFLLTRSANTSGSGPFSFPDKRFTSGQLAGAEDNLKQITRLKQLGQEKRGQNDPEVQAIVKDLGERAGMATADIFRNFSLGKAGLQGFSYPNGKMEDMYEPDDVLARIRAIREKKADGIRGEAAGSLATSVARRATAVESLTAGQSAFSAMARDLPVTDRAKSLSQFESALPILGQLPGGLANMAKAELQVRPLLESGKIREAAAALLALSEAFRQAADGEFTEAEVERAAAIAATTAILAKNRSQVEALYTRQSRTRDTDLQIELQQEIDTTNAKIKDQQESLRGLQGSATRPVADPLAGERLTRLDDRSTDRKLATEAFGSQFGNTGIPELDHKLGIGAARMEMDFMMSDLARTRAANAPRKGVVADEMVVLQRRADEQRRRAGLLQGSLDQDSSPAGPENDAWREGTTAAARQNVAAAEGLERQHRALAEELALREALESRLTVEIQLIEDAVAEAERKLEIERQAAVLRESYDDGASRANSSSGRFAIGRSEGEQLVNRQRGLMDAINGPSAPGSIQDPQLGAGSPRQDASEAGALTANLTAAKQNLYSIEERMNQALAERANLESTITEESRKQSEEASKRLALASREDQLRSAAAAALLRGRGQTQFSSQEFQYFSESTRGALSNFSPRSVQNLDDTDRDNARRRGDLDGEIGLLATSLRKMREEFDNASPYATTRSAGLLDPTKMFPGGRDLNGVVGSAEHDRFNLNLGGVNVNLDFAKHVEGITRVLQGHLDASLSTALLSLRTSGLRSPDMSAAANAW